MKFNKAFLVASLTAFAFTAVACDKKDAKKDDKKADAKKDDSKDAKKDDKKE